MQFIVLFTGVKRTYEVHRRFIQGNEIRHPTIIRSKNGDTSILYISFLCYRPNKVVEQVQHRSTICRCLKCNFMCRVASFHLLQLCSSLTFERTPLPCSLRNFFTEQRITVNALKLQMADTSPTWPKQLVPIATNRHSIMDPAAQNKTKIHRMFASVNNYSVRRLIILSQLLIMMIKCKYISRKVNLVLLLPSTIILYCYFV